MSIGGSITPTEPARHRTDRLADAFFERVRIRDEEGALELIRQALATGADHETILLEVIALVQTRVGVMWQANELSVAQEHAATHVSERATGLVLEHGLARIGSTDRRGTVVAACVEGEWHGLPVRLLGDVLRLRGWRVTFLGASVPAHHLAVYLQEATPDVVALSCSLPSHLISAHGMITAATRTGVPVIAGGAGFGPDDSLARALGATLWAADARSAADLLERELPLTLPWPVEEVLAPPAEYASLVRRRRDLVRSGTEHSRRSYEARGLRLGEAALDRTVEDLGHIVDFLATALYVDDEKVFTRFLDWTRVVLRTRGVPLDSVAEVLLFLERELFDYPRTCAILRSGRALFDGVRAGGDARGRSFASLIRDSGLP
ncbi:cobalamin B12-binding domain-containing protein [Nocardiopsis alkaliphila]|uniref:cobalamin B12-binding domain-containing protein n=1 Tax=Nocardiopsis alkaliphila TaxID=225762 RepID=UPI000349B1DC|nr:cobalamin-dependent protein [Nocardiopsis alkaliphila]